MNNISIIARLSVIIFIIVACSEEQSSANNTIPEPDNIQIDQSQQRVFIKTNNVGQLIISAPSDMGDSLIYILNDPGLVPFKSNEFDGMVIENDASLEVINYTNSSSYIFSVVGIDDAPSDAIKITGLITFKSDLPADLSFIQSDYSFYQTVYLYYCNTNDIIPDQKVIDSFQRSVRSSIERGGVPPGSCGATSCSNSYSTGIFSYSCSVSCGPGYRAHCYINQIFPFVHCDCVDCEAYGPHPTG